MNKILIILFCAFVSITKAQNSDVEKSIIGIQTGYLGTWVFSEFKLMKKTVLRTEFGLNTGSKFNADISFIMGPEFVLEPRFYYNINRRAEKGKITKNNSANFFTITTRYSPDWFVISNIDNINIPSQILIAPKWGIRRSFNNHFNYELGIGLGIRSFFGKKIGFNNQSSELSSDLHIRIGYDF